MVNMFKPMLAPNESVDLATIKYPILVSPKLDGIRGVFMDGKLLSRSLKYIQNKQIQERYFRIVKYCQDNNFILDGEFYSPELSFQEITHYVMTRDLEDELLPSHLKFYVFDVIEDNNTSETFSSRLDNAIAMCTLYPESLSYVRQKSCFNFSEVEKEFQESLAIGAEGLILRDPDGRYKFGRGTIKEGLIYKMKPFITFDAKVLDVIQSTEVYPEAERKVNELGRHVTSKKKVTGS